jgi:hypothetical protein
VSSPKQSPALKLKLHFNPLPMKNFLASLALCFADIVGVRVYAGQPEALVFLSLMLLALPLFLLSAVNLNNAID